MAIEIFNRYENKYLISSETCTNLQNSINQFMELDTYNKKNDLYPVANLYYDTRDSALIRYSMSKPIYKEKLRIRLYGDANPEDGVYVEIKKKVMGLTNKRRTSMTLAQAQAFLTTGVSPRIEPVMNKQVINEVAYLLAQNPLEPALYLAYDRKAYFGLDDHDLRLSFDTNIRSRVSHLDLNPERLGEPLLPKDTWLMEVKTRRSIPLWLAGLLADHQVYPTSFSKYGKAYQSRLGEGEGMSVANKWMQNPQPAASAQRTLRIGEVNYA